MQVKLVITTLAFMLTMIIFGYAALREPARMETFANAFEARKIEFGGDIYHNNCESCHGVNGKAEECYDAEGEPAACAGRSLANRELLCGDRSARMDAMGWAGTKEGFISGTIHVGRAAQGMPTWGVDFGGPLEAYQVDYVTQYVLNFEGDLDCSTPVEIPEWPANVAELPAGDAAAGAEKYEITYGCSACHGDPAVEGSNAVGPWAGNFADLDEVRVAGYTAADYSYESILLPNAYISPDCPTGPCASPSGMPDNFGLRMSFQDMADIMAYLELDASATNGVEVVYPPEN